MNVNTDPLHSVGLSLGEAFLRHVLFNEEVKSAAGEIPKAESAWVAVLQEGQAPGPYVDYKWALDATGEQLADETVRPLVFFVHSPDPIPSEFSVRLSNLIASRIAQLRAWLCEGLLVVTGTSAATDAVITVDRFHWKRAGLMLDVKNSDLYEPRESKLELRFTGLSLSAPKQQLAEQPNMSHVKPPVHDPIRSAASVHDSSELGPVRKRKETSTRSARECEAWLFNIYAASPTQRLQPRSDLFKQAKKLWPDLSVRVFDDARRSAADRANAKVWLEPGAPRKRPRK